VKLNDTLRNVAIQRQGEEDIFRYSLMNEPPDVPEPLFDGILLGFETGQLQRGFQQVVIDNDIRSHLVAKVYEMAFIIPNGMAAGKTPCTSGAPAFDEDKHGGGAEEGVEERGGQGSGFRGAKTRSVFRAQSSVEERARKDVPRSAPCFVWERLSSRDDPGGEPLPPEDMVPRWSFRQPESIAAEAVLR
jgi:hypothetical protein